MKFTCRHCGEDFKASPEELGLYEEGYAGAPDLCDGCSRFLGSPPNLEYEQYSDADPGL